jgi:hypothetical protein
MNTVIVLVLAFMSYSSVACSNLSGEYICTTPEIPGGDPYFARVEQNSEIFSETMFLENGEDSVTTYTLDGRNHRAAFGIKYKAFCEENKNMRIEYKLLFTKSWTKYVPTRDGFVIYRRESKHSKYKINKVCKLQ